jgi:hypothetical protein
MESEEIPVTKVIRARPVTLAQLASLAAMGKTASLVHAAREVRRVRRARRAMPVSPERLALSASRGLEVMRAHLASQESAAQSERKVSLESQVVTVPTEHQALALRANLESAASLAQRESAASRVATESEASKVSPERGERPVASAYAESAESQVSLVATGPREPVG